MASHELMEFPDLWSTTLLLATVVHYYGKFYTTEGHQEFYLPHPTKFLRLLLCLKTFYTTIGQYPTLYDFLVTAPKEISCWNYYLTYPNNLCETDYFLAYTTTTITVLRRDVTLHV